MNLKKSFVFLPALAFCVFASACSKSRNDPKDGLDPRIRRLCDKTGLVALPTENGEVLMIVKTTDELGQMCWIAPRVIDADGTECIYVGSYIAKWDEINEEVWGVLMNQNTRRRNNVFAESSDYLVLRALVPLASKPDDFRDAIESLAIEADNIERVYFGREDVDFNKK